MASDSEENMSFCEEESSFGVGDSDDNSFDQENVNGTTMKTNAVKGKAAVPSMKKDILSPSKEDNTIPFRVDATEKPKKTIEDKYQKKTQLEHILLRPDTYIGSIERLTAPMYVLSSEEQHKIIQKEITFTPGLYKIFDEIVVNAADNKQRDGNMDRLDITIDAENNWISVRNNGEGIPIEFHKKEKMYVPTLIFGHLLTGSNFDDGERKTTGGRNGYGAKLANVFSTKFVVECLDTERKLKFRQVFCNNMSVAEDPLVENATAKELKGGDFVNVSFSPDLSRFKMSHLDSDTVALLSKRAYDIAGTMGNNKGKRLQVWLNQQKLPIKNFKDYIACIESVEAPVAYANDNCWEVAIAPSLDSTLMQISFVNSIATYKGGAHVNYIADQVAGHLVKVLKKKNKGGVEIKKALVVNHLAIFVNCLIENPSFDSQTKDFMTTAKRAFGSTFDLSPEFLKKVEKSDISKNILAYSSFRDKQALNRKGGTKKVKLTGIPKLDDANYAGTVKSKDCTLIITEGDSAKSLAVAGLSVIGRDFYGVFPLKGKPMNVRDETYTKAANNPEIQNLVNILGLKYNQSYDGTNIKTLRYGHLMIMADQDVDGSHIKGLVINFIHTFWPSLLDLPGFLQQFITPIVKVSPKDKKQIKRILKEPKAFYTLPEFEQWVVSHNVNLKDDVHVKYYKGLGTSSSAEAKEYFSTLGTHQITFLPLSLDVAEHESTDDEVLPDKVESGSDLIDMVFRKDRVEDRKQWLLNCPTGIFLDYKEVAGNGLRYSDFINREYIQFSKYDNDRSIPHLLDGFKTSQRKVLFGCLKRNLTTEAKVAQLTGYIAEHSAYHHGEQSLQGTIVNMAQDFVGSNNINLLTPCGQFGTRRMGGKDAASARYIHTKLEKITRAIFHPDDDDLLSYLEDEGDSIEPQFYIPVIPMILVNGAEGIGSGWSSNVLNYNARDVIANIRSKLAGEELKPLTPYYNGFIGDITLEKKNKYINSGILSRVDDTTILITELPIKKWTQTYKEFLEEMLVNDSKRPAELKDMRENHTETSISFTVSADKENIDAWEKEKNGLLGKFKLTGSLSSSNMTLFDEEGSIVRYEDPNDILNAFFDIRHEYYQKRKANLIRFLEADKKKLSNKARFVKEVCSGTLVVSNRKRKDILSELHQRGYDLIEKNVKKKVEKDIDDGEDNLEIEEDEVATANLAKGYEYLLGMAIWSLTFEKAEHLLSILAEKTVELESLQAMEPGEIWLNDLDAIEQALNERDRATCKNEADERHAQEKNRKYQAKTKVVVRHKKVVPKCDKQQSSDAEMQVDPKRKELLFVDSKKTECKKTACKKAINTNMTGNPPKPSSKLNAVLNNTKPDTVLRAPTEFLSVEESDDDSIVEESLMDRMKKKLTVSPLKKLEADGNYKSKKRPSPRVAELEDSGDDHDLEPNDVRPLKVKEKRTVPRKKKTEVARNLKNGPQTKKTTIVKKNSTQRTLASDDSDVVMSSSDDELPVGAPSLRAAPRRVARSKPIVYDFDSLEDTDNEDNDSL